MPAVPQVTHGSQSHYTLSSSELDDLAARRAALEAELMAEEEDDEELPWTPEPDDADPEEFLGESVEQPPPPRPGPKPGSGEFYGDAAESQDGEPR